MEEENTFNNPSSALGERSFYSPNSSEYAKVFQKLYDVAKQVTLLYYCEACHSIETRDTIVKHSNEDHTIHTKSKFYGKIINQFSSSI